MLSPFRSHGFALSFTVPAHLRFTIPAVRCSMEHTFDYTVMLFSPLALLPTMASADFSQFVVTTKYIPPVRSHGISSCSFLVYPPDLRTWVTATFGALLLLANSPAIYALYQVSVRRATISLSFLLACTSRCKPWESLSSSSVATPMWTFTTEHGHARHTKKAAIRITDNGIFIIIS